MPHSTPQKDTTKRPIRVLLVEDSPSDAELLQEALLETEAEGFQFVLAESLTEALESLHKNSFDVLLLDLSLPDSFGTETFRKAREKAPNLPIVVLTGTDNEILGLQAVRHGVQDYLIKGQSDGRLVARAIRYAIERKRSEDALRHSEELLADKAKHLEELVQERTRTLQETVQELEHFSYSITHDMRAPLRAMQGFAHILLQEECADCTSPKRKEYLQRIATAAQRMDNLIRDALYFSDAVRTEYPLKPVDLRQFLENLLADYPAFQSPQADVKIEGEFPMVLANEAGLTQCFSNLLDNAVKFVPTGVHPKVRIWAEKDALPIRPEASTAGNPLDHFTPPSAHEPAPGTPMTRIWIKDNGIGIPKEAKRKIFGLFQQLSRDPKGTGIGLAVVRKAVQRMGGSVGVESEPGDGSSFWLELRRAD